jgi:hypothetical protein
MCLLIVYYASNNKFMCFANASSACVMLGDPAITAGAWQTDMVQLVNQSLAHIHDANSRRNTRNISNEGLGIVGH